ncbi:MAG: DUF2911 domain-containing protein [Bacteroidota bacterium]|jgi:hypothetical protein|nr:DUF2911 domain-containing protein [Cytophagales bacterium]MCE2958264.1 DUF2911 domain-containing protein [Flammeovirgaceae bacterium]MCZ8070982.1 DUF2911 domain-containing protein [Cytophagales bacterium]
MLKKLLITVTLVATVFACTKKESSQQQRSVKDSTTAKVDVATEAIIEAQSSPDEKKGSIKAKASTRFGDMEMQVLYYSPAVRERIVWGGLVPYDKVWVTGAHSATSVEFNKDLEIDGKIIVAGKYAFFTIPGKETWTIILNKNWRQHLTDQYDPKQDVIRVTVKPEREQRHQERLRYVIEKDSEYEGELVVYWEKIEVSLPFKVK